MYDVDDWVGTRRFQISVNRRSRNSVGLTTEARRTRSRRQSTEGATDRPLRRATRSHTMYDFAEGPECVIHGDMIGDPMVVVIQCMTSTHGHPLRPSRSVSFSAVSFGQRIADPASWSRGVPTAA